MQIRKMVSEVMIYDADDASCSTEANNSVPDVGAWTVDIQGVHGVAELTGVLDQYVGIRQLSFCTHGFPGGVYFRRGCLTAGNLKSVVVPDRLFGPNARLLFMGCETARGKDGEDFLIAAGKHFFAGKGGIVGGANIYILGLPTGARLPILGGSSAGWHRGRLRLYQFDPSGKVTGNQVVKAGLPF